MRRTRVRPEVGLELSQLRPAAEEELDVGEAEADAARDGLRRVAADEEAVLIGGRVVQQRQLRHGQVLHLVDDDLVQRRVAPLLRLEVEDLSRSTRVSWMASPFARLPRWQSWERGARSHTSYRPFFFFFLRYSSKASYAAGRIAGSSGDCLLASARYSSRER